MGLDPPPADHTPSGRGVCLISSSCKGPLTTMTGSNLAGHRLLEGARRAVLRHRAPRTEGCLTPPLNRDPHHPALRASSLAPPVLKLLPLAGKSFRPLGGGQCRAIDPTGGIGQYPSDLFTAVWNPPARSTVPEARCGVRTPAGGGRRGPSRSRPSENPSRKKRSGRRHDWREASADRRECGLPVGVPLTDCHKREVNGYPGSPELQAPQRDGPALKPRRCPAYRISAPPSPAHSAGRPRSSSRRPVSGSGRPVAGHRVSVTA